MNAPRQGASPEQLLRPRDVSSRVFRVDGERHPAGKQEAAGDRRLLVVAFCLVLGSRL